MRIAPFLVVAAFMCGCGDDPMGAHATLMELPLEDGDVRAVVTAQVLGDGLTSVEISLHAQSVEIGAYQGRVMFEPSVLKFVQESMPDGGYRVVNTLRASEGEIRFAGFTVEGYASPVVLKLWFEAARLVQDGDVAVDLEVVGDLLGKEVPRGRVMKPLFMRVD
jgi:hypothetical protein